MQNRLQLGVVGHGFDALLGLNYKHGKDYDTKSQIQGITTEALILKADIALPIFTDLSS